MIKRALWLEKPQHSSDCPASQLSPPWEGPGKAPQVSSPLLGRGRGRLCKFKLPSLGEARESSSSRLSPPWERPGKAPQVSSPLLGRGRGRLCKFKPPSLGEAGEGSSSRLSPPWEGQGEAPQVSTPLPWGGVGGGFLLFSFTKPFARQPVLRSKRITVGNTRVLSLFATH